MSWNNRRLVMVIATLIAVISVPSLAHAQRGGGRGRTVARPIIVAPYYSRFYDPFWDFYGWGYPGWSPAFNNRNIADTSAARVQVTPRQTEVFVDGYLAGVADDFDGMTQRLRVEPGEHVIELYLDGHKSIAQTIMFEPGETYRIRHAMEPLAAGEATPARPAPTGPPPGSAPPPAYDAFGQPMGRGPGPGAGPAARGSASIAIRVQPGDSTILVDGERWQSSGERLEIQVTPGEHKVEVHKDGYQPFSTNVRIAPGENSSLNVSLTKSGGE